MKSILEASANYAGNIDIQQDLSGCITIYDLDTDNDPIWFNEHESERFMQQVKKYYDECDVTMDIAMKAVARPYVECIWN